MTIWTVNTTMSRNPYQSRRRSVRKKGYDYAQGGVYFVTICTHQKACLFGEVTQDGEMRLNDCGHIVQQEWEQTAMARPNVDLDTFVIMPNHVHGIIVIHSDTAPTSVAETQHAASLQSRGQFPGGATRTNVKPGSLPAVVRGFKSAVTRRINLLRDTPGAPVWQGRYYDVIIWNETMLNKRRQYILTNPARWAFDEDNPTNINR